MATITARDLGAETATPTIAPNDKQTSTSGSVETPEAATTQKSEEVLSPKFAALARKEKALRAQALAERSKLDSERKALEAERAELEKVRSWQSKLKDDPFSVLNEAGLSYEELTNRLLNQPGPQDQALRDLQKKIQELEASQKQTLTQAEEAQKRQYEDVKKQIRNEVSLLVDGNDTFELIKSQGAEDAVVELIESVYQSEQRLMTAEEAANEVEEYLLDEAMKVAQLKKIQSKLSPPKVEAPEAEKQQTSTSKQPQSPTLSNRMVQSTAKPMSAKERRDRAIKAFLGQLNS